MECRWITSLREYLQFTKKYIKKRIRSQNFLYCSVRVRRSYLSAIIASYIFHSDLSRVPDVFSDLRNKIYAQPNRGPLAPGLLTHTHAICMSSPALKGTTPPLPRPLAADDSGVEGSRGQSSWYDKLWYSAVSVVVQLKLTLRSSLLYVL